MTVEENGALRFQRCKCQSIRDAMGAMDRSGIPPGCLGGLHLGELENAGDLAEESA